MSLCLSVSLFLSLSFYLPIYLFIYLSTFFIHNSFFVFEADPVFGPIYFLAYIFFVFFVLLNVFLGSQIYKYRNMQIFQKSLFYIRFILYRVFIFKNSRRFATSLSPAAIGCTKNYQPIRVTVHSYCIKSFEGLLQRCRRGRGQL